MFSYGRDSMVSIVSVLDPECEGIRPIVGGEYSTFEGEVVFVTSEDHRRRSVEHGVIIVTTIRPADCYTHSVILVGNLTRCAEAVLRALLQVDPDCDQFRLPVGSMIELDMSDMACGVTHGEVAVAILQVLRTL